MASTVDRISEHIARVVGDLGQVSGDVNAARQMLAMLGWDLPPAVDDIGLASLDVSQLVSRLDHLTELRSREDATDVELTLAIAAVIDGLIVAYGHIQSLTTSLQATPEYLSATRIADELFPRLADLVTIHTIGSVVPGGLPVGRLLGLFEFTPMPADPAIFQVAYVRQVVRWDRFSLLVHDPAGLMRDVYGWGTPAFDGNLLITNIARVMEYIAAEVITEPLPREIEEQIAGRPVPEADAAPGTQLTVSLDQGLGFDAFDIGVRLFNLRASAAGGADGGIGLSPFATGTTDTSFPLSDSLSLVPAAIADLQGGLSVILRAGRDPALLTGLFVLPDESGTPAPVSFGLSLRNAAAAGGRLALFSAPGLSVDAAAVTAGLAITPGDNPNPALSASIQDGRVRLVPGRPDGFLASILPADGITTTLNLTVSWSQRDGLRIQGGAGLRTTLVLHQKAGPLQIDTLDLALTAQSDELDLDVTITGSTLLGPLTAQVDSIGVSLALQFKRGNLGNADLGARFKPPRGVGLSIDSAGVTGAGFLLFDSDKGQYAGIVQLNLEGGIAVTGVGLIATRLPNNASGFSLIIVITAQDFKPIPLGLGFNLTGIGGLLAINRTFDEQALRAGLRNHTLDSILFPKDPIRNAPQILSNLNRVFPPANGHHLFGPVVQIAWGTPPLITANLAIMLELGARLRLLVLAQISAILPRPDHDLIRLQMDAVGVIDFDQGTAELDATLHDSRLLRKFVLTGDMAMRLKWEGSPNFALAVGGLHPAFNPPPNFPKLERVAINLAAGDNPRLRCEAYFALTANTVQFGARAELYASASGFSIQGELGFDVLIQLVPFSFLADFHAQLQLKRGSTNLFKVRVEGSLAGPRPLHIKAKATFEILWWDVTVRVDKTLVEGDKPPLPAPVDVLSLLREALGNAGNWVSQLPSGQRQVVTLRDVSTGASPTSLLHPLGTLTIKQNVVPLDLDISRFGSSSPAGARRFSISGVSVGGQDQLESTHPVRDFFAPAQFIEMSDDAKLSRPSFESMAAGVAIGSGDFDISANAADWLEVPAIEFETLIVDKETGETRSSQPQGQPGRYQLRAALLGQQARFGAAGNSDLRRTGKARYRSAVNKYQVSREGWTIASTEDLSVQPVSGATAPLSYSEAVQALQTIQQQQPARAGVLKILRRSELTTT